MTYQWYTAVGQGLPAVSRRRLAPQGAPAAMPDYTTVDSPCPSVNLKGSPLSLLLSNLVPSVSVPT